MVSTWSNYARDAEQAFYVTLYLDVRSIFWPVGFWVCKDCQNLVFYKRGLVFFIKSGKNRGFSSEVSPWITKNRDPCPEVPVKSVTVSESVMWTWPSTEQRRVPISGNWSLFEGLSPFRDLFDLLGPCWVPFFIFLGKFTQRISIQQVYSFDKNLCYWSLICSYE